MWPKRSAILLNLDGFISLDNFGGLHNLQGRRGQRGQGGLGSLGGRGGIGGLGGFGNPSNLAKAGGAPAAWHGGQSMGQSPRNLRPQQSGAAYTAARTPT